MWRTHCPEIQKSCTKCGLCWVYCPEEAIYKDKKENFQVDLELCKGCGICQRECPFAAIKMEAEA